jgi:nucleotide-binding universal stress UspA family protein
VAILSLERGSSPPEDTLYKRVVLAFDGSVEGRSALREGALIAVAHGSEVHLLSVIPDAAGLNMAEGLHSGAVAQVQECYRAVLAEGVARMKQSGLDPIACQLQGEPAPQIGAYARRVQADLVVIGHRKPNRIARWWSGSAGGLLVDNIDCSILISRKVIGDDEFFSEMKRLAGQFPFSPASPPPRPGPTSQVPGRSGPRRCGHT